MATAPCVTPSLQGDKVTAAEPRASFGYAKERTPSLQVVLDESLVRVVLAPSHCDSVTHGAAALWVQSPSGDRRRGLLEVAKKEYGAGSRAGGDADVAASYETVVAERDLLQERLGSSCAAEDSVQWLNQCPIHCLSHPLVVAVHGCALV